MYAVSLPLEVDCNDGVTLQDADPDLVAVFLMCVGFLNAHPVTKGLPVTVTSVLRPGDVHSVHAYGRGIDFTIEGIGKHEVIRVLLDLTAMVNTLLPYRAANGTPGRSAVFRINTGKGSDAKHQHHVHLQKPVTGWG